MNMQQKTGNAGQQALIEHEILKHLTGAMRVTLDWKIQEDDVSRPLSSLRFVAQSMQRHLVRMMSLEEHDGYMNEVIESRPELANKVEALREEHGRFKKTIRRLVLKLKRLAPTDVDGYEKLRDELGEFMAAIEAHGITETQIIQEAFLRDEGGSG